MKHKMWVSYIISVTIIYNQLIISVFLSLKKNSRGYFKNCNNNNNNIFVKGQN